MADSAMKSCLLALLLFLPLVLWGGAISAPAAADSLSLTDRIKAQTAIERIFYEKRTWPKENKTAKPPFETMVRRELIEKKVNETLLKSAAVAKKWGRAIT